MTKLEALAVELHDHLWANMGMNDDWPLQVSADEDEVMDEFIRLMNELQREIKACGYNHIEYDPSKSRIAGL